MTNSNFNWHGISEDGNVAVWVGFCPTRPTLIRYPFQKTCLPSHPACFNGYPFNPTRHGILVLNKRRPIIENIAILTFGLFEFLTGPFNSFKLAHVDFGDFLCLFLSTWVTQSLNENEVVNPKSQPPK